MSNFLLAGFLREHGVLLFFVVVVVVRFQCRSSLGLVPAPAVLRRNLLPRPSPRGSRHEVANSEPLQCGVEPPQLLRRRRGRLDGGPRPVRVFRGSVAGCGRQHLRSKIHFRCLRLPAPAPAEPLPDQGEWPFILGAGHSIL